MLGLSIFLFFLCLGYFAGRRFEQQHFLDIGRREQKMLYLPTTNSKRPIGAVKVVNAQLVSGSVVISVDYFKKVLAALRKLFGGNIRAYESLVDRARREAILRLKESCPDATQIINLRIETSAISQGDHGQIGSVEVLAYATAIYGEKG